MTPADWSRIQQGIFKGESGGDYGALFGYQNRPNGRFSDVNLTSMTVDQALDFANPSGPYGQYVKGQVGRVATPMGAYQIVGSTLRDAKKAMGLTGNEVLTPAMQDKIGQWIYKTQGTGAWEGYTPMTDAQAIGAETMQVLGKKPQGILAPTQTSETESKPMMQEEKPRGLLGSLGIQKMEEGAAGETGQRFYERDSFKDTAVTLAQGFGRMGIMGMEEIADDIAKQRTENKARNKTIEAISKMGTPQSQAAVEYIKAGGDPVSALKMAFAQPESATPSSAIGKLQSDLASGLINQEQYDVALANMAPSGMSLEVGPDGTTRFVQGAGASTKPLTEGQSKATGYYGKAQEAEAVLSALEKQGTDLYDSLISNVPIAGNYMISKEYQQYSQAKRNFINSILRQESGAAIGKDEFANAEQQYFPQAGDGPAVIAQKAANRRQAIEGLKVAAGEGAGRIGSPTPSGVIEYDATGKRVVK